MTGPRYAFSTVATVRSYSPHRGIRSAEQQTKTFGASVSTIAFTRRSCSACLNDHRKQMAIASTPFVTSFSIACREGRSEEHTSELQSLRHLVCRLLLEKKHKT